MTDSHAHCDLSRVAQGRVESDVSAIERVMVDLLHLSHRTGVA
jgi:hypothetical protein